MGGSAESTYNKAKETVSAVTDAAGNVIFDKAGNAINSATGGTISIIGKAGSKLGQISGNIGDAVSTASDQTVNAINKAGTQTGNALETAVGQTGNFLEEAYNDGKNLVNKIIDLPNKLKAPKMGGIQQAADGVGITDVTGRRKKRRGSTDVRSGLAATMLAKPQNLLGNAGGISSNQGKAKLGQ